MAACSGLPSIRLCRLVVARWWMVVAEEARLLGARLLVVPGRLLLTQLMVLHPDLWMLS